MIADERNAAEVAFWNGPGGHHWVRRQEAWDFVLAPVSAIALARAAVRSAERVVDIGCGCGATTLELAKLVGARGRVLGLDISAPMLARAATRVPSGSPVELVQADATGYAFARGGFDLLFSRFGVMFFAEPARAFANLRTALGDGGRLVFVCFRAAQENPWMMTPLKAAYAHVPPLPKLAPEAPGPFSFASEERIRHILGNAGFHSVEVTPVDLDLDIAGGRGLDEAVASALEIGATSRAIEGQPTPVRDAVAASVRQALAAHRRGTAVPLGAAIWLVSAISASRAP
jgi:ubiquinone/menaquinone biosynthesis C-methylase UbiE